MFEIVIESNVEFDVQAVILILEGNHSAEVKEQALCILANIADGDTAKDYIMANEDVLKKLQDYMVSSTIGNYWTKWIKFYHQL